MGQLSVLLLPLVVLQGDGARLFSMTHCSFQADLSVLYGEMALRAQASIGWIDGGTIGYPMHASTGWKRVN